MYLAISKYALSAVLVIEDEDRIQHPVYYVSKQLIDAETKYLDIEKLALVLVIASRKLRPYLEAHPIVVLTNYLLRQALAKLDTAGRLMKYAIEIGQFTIKYRPRTAIKG